MALHYSLATERLLKAAEELQLFRRDVQEVFGELRLTGDLPDKLVQRLEEKESEFLESLSEFLDESRRQASDASWRKVLDNARQGPVKSAKP